jgi:hypothetical protein
VPVTVTVDVHTFRRHGRRTRHTEPLQARLVDAAFMDTPTPDELPGTPLERLTGKQPGDKE